MRAFGKYRLLELLATGGMAEVWRAEVTGAEGVVKAVALKLVRGEHEARSAFVRMFVQEARLAARLGHANVVQVFEFDQVGSRYYIAMELVRGRDLSRVVARAREAGVRLGVARAVHVGVEVAKALAHAHRLSDAGRPLGVVHRDVSPHNVLVSFEGEVKLADFGIARAMNLAELTDPGTVKGKLAYMAPEQARGEPVDARADVFALGVVVWELCAGRRLFARDSEAATLAAVLEGAISPPSEWNEEVPPELDRAILTALERDAARRTASAQELAATLSGVLLRVARSADDFDLRPMMHRLFPEAAAPDGQSSPESTRVRPIAIAAESVAAPMIGRAAPDESATRTAPAARSRPRRVLPWAAALAGALVAVVLGARLLVLRARSIPGAVSPALAARAPGPVASPAEVAPASRETPAPSSTVGESPAPPASGEASAVERSDGEAPPTWRSGLVGLDPVGAAGEGVVAVSAPGWARIWIDEALVCDTPCQIRLPAGAHRVRVKGPGGAATATLAVDAGRRIAWHAKLR